ncbi:prohead protease/major capsid protein fusion protein [Salipiger marinus]|uniref:prohead protease/major capsid protein fusion protein n=1 Tax=Salipiger marinus TaxID=555512 RepID=UPI002CC2B821|nr:prohead protease/major capsid protein fusion protein [Salipiger manganoxidans]MEB3417029.1 prohead protease/major capsid protein fusion protein [Salipiger manganoxidans]
MSLHLRSLSPSPSTVDPVARTVEAIVSTGADAPRAGYVERLDLTGADLSRLIGAPVLDAHRSASTRDQLGVIEAAELRREGIWVRMKFRSNPAAAAVLSDIQDGTLRGLSIGYQVNDWQERRDGSRLVRTAKRWTPVEVSLVPVPADPGAHFRNGDPAMPDNAPPEGETLTPTPPPTMTRAQINVEIRSIAETAGLSRAWADEQIDAEVTPEDARRAAFEAMQRRSATTATRTTRATITADHTDPAVIATRAGEALFARSHPDHQLTDAARPYANFSFVDLARDCLQRSGGSFTGLAADTVITRALHTTSDFPLILGDAVNRELRRAYEAAPSAVRQVARQTTARDFRAKRALQFGTGPDLKKVGESGEFQRGTIQEAAEGYSVETFGRIFAISRQALVNDDLGAFTQIPAKLGDAARAFEAQQLVDKLTENPAMSDGIAVFHADHHNLTAAFADPSLASLAAGRLAMRRQKGLAGELINAAPRFVVVPPELEVAAEQALAEIAATKTADVNPFDNLTLLVEARLTNAEQWYITADPATIDGLEYAYLEGAPGPQVETRQGFEVDGVQMKVRLDFGCGWIDHRGWHRVG